MAYTWPGNVRELENILERYAVLVGEGEPSLYSELIISFPELQPLAKEALDNLTTVGTEVLFEEHANIREKELIKSISVRPGTLADMEVQLISALLEMKVQDST